MTEIPPTIFVVDDDESVRKGLVRLLKSAGYRPEGFASAEEFLDRWEEDPTPGCVLLDIQMPGLDGLQLQQNLQSAGHPIPIIFITGHGDVPMSVKAMKAGAVDFLSKPFRDEDLLDAIQQAIRRDVQQRAVRAEREAFEKRYGTLTPREREVMAGVVGGLPNKQIASVLGASEKTIKIHRARVMEKMRVQSIADLVRAAEKLEMPPAPLLPPR
jgi:FixJ family two-component response regulator